MATIYPLARIGFLPEPLCNFDLENLAASFLTEADRPMFSAEPAVTFDFAPYSITVKPVDQGRIYDEDTGASLFDEDDGVFLFAEDPT